jgi:hypothetical protein
MLSKDGELLRSSADNDTYMAGDPAFGSAGAVRTQINQDSHSYLRAVMGSRRDAFMSDGLPLSADGVVHAQDVVDHDCEGVRLVLVPI